MTNQEFETEWAAHNERSSSLNDDTPLQILESKAIARNMYIDEPLAEFKRACRSVEAEFLKAYGGIN